MGRRPPSRENFAAMPPCVASVTARCPRIKYGRVKPTWNLMFAASATLTNGVDAAGRAVDSGGMLAAAGAVPAGGAGVPGDDAEEAVIPPSSPLHATTSTNDALISIWLADFRMRSII